MGDVVHVERGCPSIYRHTPREADYIVGRFPRSSKVNWGEVDEMNRLRAAARETSPPFSWTPGVVE